MVKKNCLTSNITKKSSNIQNIFLCMNFLLHLKAEFKIERKCLIIKKAFQFKRKFFSIFWGICKFITKFRLNFRGRLWIWEEISLAFKVPSKFKRRFLSTVSSAFNLKKKFRLILMAASKFKRKLHLILKRDFKFKITSSWCYVQNYILNIKGFLFRVIL